MRPEYPGIQVSSEVAVFPLQAAVIEARGDNQKNLHFLWKVLVVASVLLFSLTLAPKSGASEKSLTAENLLALLNQDRLAANLSPLKANARLTAAAQAKAANMLQNNYFAHTSPSSLKPWDFIRAAGFDYSFAGENLAINYNNSYELEHDLLASPSHRENLHSANFTDIGIAILRGAYQGQEAVITVQMFARPAR